MQWNGLVRRTTEAPAARRSEASASLEPNSIVIVSLHTPKEKLWGSLVSMNASGVTRARHRSEFVRRFHPAGDGPGGRAHRLAHAVFPDAARRAHRARRAARIDSVAFRSDSSSAWDAPAGLSRAIRVNWRESKSKMASSRLHRSRISSRFSASDFLPFFIISIHYRRYDIALGDFDHCGADGRRWTAFWRAR